MLLKPKLTNEEFLDYDVSVHNIKNKYEVSFGPHKNIIIGLPEVTVKYPLNDYDKITVKHKCGLFSVINDRIKKNVPNLVDLVFDEICCKVPTDMKNEVKKVKRGDVVKIAVKFNDCWDMKGKVYYSFELFRFSILQQSKDEKDKVDDDDESAIDF